MSFHLDQGLLATWDFHNYQLFVEVMVCLVASVLVSKFENHSSNPSSDEKSKKFKNGYFRTLFIFVFHTFTIKGLMPGFEPGSLGVRIIRSANCVTNTASRGRKLVLLDHHISRGRKKVPGLLQHVSKDLN